MLYESKRLKPRDATSVNYLNNIKSYLEDEKIGAKRSLEYAEIYNRGYYQGYYDGLEKSIKEIEEMILRIK